MRFRSQYKIEIGKLELAPLIDVVFLLLIFFMLTSKFILPYGIKIEIPYSKTAQRTEGRRLIITLDRKGDIYLSRSFQAKRRKITCRELTQILRNMKERKSVLIQADKHTSLENLINIWDICRENRIEEIEISTLPFSNPDSDTE